MKVLIWFLTLLIGTILNSIIGIITGLQAGAMLLYLLEYFIAKKLCEKWDEHKAKKENPQVCEACGKALPKNARFCRKCGAEIKREEQGE